MRTTKAIRNLIGKNEDHLKDLLREHALDDVCSVVKPLLEQRIFESTLRAKIRFPEVFEVSPGQSAERAASEAEAARSEANKISAAAGSSAEPMHFVDKKASLSTLPLGHDLRLGEKHQILFALSLRLQLAHRPGSPSQMRHPSKRSEVPSLYPVYLPYQAQYQLLVGVQSLLEYSCYKFAEVNFQNILTEREWLCPESVELTTWPKILRDNQSMLSEAAIARIGKPLVEVLNSMTLLRNTAVHRVVVSAKRIEGFLNDADALLKILQDDVRMEILAQLRRELSYTVDELHRQKDLLESRLASRLDDIAAQREKLDKLERAAVQSMLEEDKENLGFVEAHLMDTLPLYNFKKGKGPANHASSSQRGINEPDPETEQETAIIVGDTVESDESGLQ